MSLSTETIPFRQKIRVGVSNFLQKYRGVLFSFIGAVIVVIVGLAIWTQVDAGSRNAFAAQIEKSQNDFLAWESEKSDTKKSELAAALEGELAKIENQAPTGYGLSKAWFLHGNYWATQKKWADAAKAYRSVYDKDPSSYLAPIALVNAGVSLEEAQDLTGAQAQYAEFEKSFATNGILAPQVFFTQGRLLEQLNKSEESIVAYKKVLEKFPDSSWTKLARDRILLLSRE